jgi:hypothetical protein
VLFNNSWFSTTDAVPPTAAAVPPVLCLHGAFGSGKSLTLCAVCVLIDSLAQAHTAATTAAVSADATDDTTAISNSSSSSSSGYNCYGHNSTSSSSSDIQTAAAAAAATATAAAAVGVSSSSSEVHSVCSSSGSSSNEVKAVGQWSRGGPRVLLASATNVAVDGVLLRLIREGFESIARLGSLRRIANVSHFLHTYSALFSSPESVAVINQ